MKDLFASFLFRLKKDLTFRITLFVGLGMAFVLAGVFYLIDHALGGMEGVKFCTGQNLLINSFSPSNNFGIAIPVNLITFTVLEFTQGITRNKIVAGNSKTKIYISYFLSGLVFTLVVLAGYVGLSVGLGSLLGGFDPNGLLMSGSSGGTSTPEYLIKFVISSLLMYVTICSLTIFFATLFRNIGPCIPVVIVMIMMLYFSGMIASLMKDTEGTEVFVNVMKYVNPMYALNDASILDSMKGTLAMADDTFIASIVNNSIYTIIFLLGGWLVFRKRDVK